MSVLSERFLDAATQQAEKLGLSEIAKVIVAHPIQDATDDEMHAKCDAVYAHIVSSLQTQQQQTQGSTAAEAAKL